MLWAYSVSKQRGGASEATRKSLWRPRGGEDRFAFDIVFGDVPPVRQCMYCKVN